MSDNAVIAIMTCAICAVLIVAIVMDPEAANKTLPEKAQCVAQCDG